MDIAANRPEANDRPIAPPLRAAYTPDPDDAFAWRSIVDGSILVRGRRVLAEPRPIEEINAACRHGAFYDIAAVSSAAYPFIASRYAILSPGASVGRGYGPALATRDLRDASELLRPGIRVAIPGEHTTGALLLRLFFPGVATIVAACDEIASGLQAGEFHAGVLIHEELLNVEKKGLRRLGCLGAMWTEKTGLPIPVGLNVARRDLGPTMLERAAFALRESMEAAERDRAGATAWAMRFTNQAEAGIGERYLGMFANDDTLDLADDCIAALRLLYAMAFDAGLIPNVPAVEPVGRLDAEGGDRSRRAVSPPWKEIA
jgi:1,4-dihydroxy-6-naphthoate synthase